MFQDWLGFDLYSPATFSHNLMLDLILLSKVHIPQMSKTQNP